MRHLMSARLLFLVLTAVAAQPVAAQVGDVAVSAATDHLVFAAAHPSSGTVQQQTETQLRELLGRHPGRLVNLRIFTRPSSLPEVTGGIRRTLDARNTKMPSVSFISVAGFPDSAQLVQLEAAIEMKSVAAKNGLAFLAGLAAPTVARTAAGLARVAREAGVERDSVQRVTCYYESPSAVDGARVTFDTIFPNATLSLVRSRSAGTAIVECEGVGTLRQREHPDVRYFNLLAGPPSPNFSHAALVSAPRLVFASSSVAEGTDEPSMEQALERVRRSAAAQGAEISNVVMGDNFWVSDAARDGLRAARARAFRGTIPAATGITVDSIADANGAASIDLVIAANREHVDTVTVTPGSRLVDGRYLVAHDAEVIQTVTRPGREPEVRRFTARKQVVARSGDSVFQLQLRGVGRDSAAFSDIVLDRKTLSLLTREDHDTAGVVQLETHGSRVSVARTGGTASSSTFTLSQPAFHASFLDAVLNGMRLRSGLVVRMPAFTGASTNGVPVWHTFRVVARDSSGLGTGAPSAWVVEEAPTDSTPARRFWLAQAPPFFPLDITYRKDGSILRTEQHLIAPRSQASLELRATSPEALLE